ncbi:MAG: 16S rRNA (guanine(966)-N(2))-methyltransferase RsmD [Clostridiales bacterium]|nr:16S rRNA (guanine(966)-N(2))-methyltransferase RsmD [Clostridiales bacterium]
MRIVGGKYRGISLTAFDGDKIRPTSDKVRESFFNIIQFEIYGKSFLDLFCGTGAMGIEALSRGAKSVNFNDASKESLAILKKNLSKIKVDGDYTITNYNAQVYLKGADKKFDFIYIDPPYKSELGLTCLPLALSVLNENGKIILEDEKPFDKEIDGLTVIDRRKYGRVHLTFFAKEK